MTPSRYLLVAAIILTTLLSLAGCGSSNPNSSMQSQSTGMAMGMVNVHVSDPPTGRGSSNGPFLHVYVTITDVQINASGTRRRQ